MGWGCVAVSLGMTPVQADLFRGTGFVGERLGDDSVFSVLYPRGHELFPDEM